MIVSMQIPDIDFFRGHTDSDNPWERWYSSNAVAWEKQLRDLRRLVKTVWERGDEAVLDLASDASPR
jgi:hypothetical protein